LKQKIFICTSNDLVNDQRVYRTASFLGDKGAELLLLGRELPDSPSLEKFDFPARRFRMIFKKGFLFYAFLNIRLLFYLIRANRNDIILSNDLDTLPACFLAAKLRRCRIVYDSHEYFTEVPELQERWLVRSIWLWMEGLLLPGLPVAFTVSKSIAEAYRSKYGVHFEVVRNLPSRNGAVKDYQLPVDISGKKIVLYQGAVNMGRGIERMMSAVSERDDALFFVAGTGDLYDQLKRKSESHPYSGKVVFLGKLPPQELRSLTKMAHLGVSLERNMGQSYFYALPNKVFDYIHAGIPLLVSDFPEMRNVVMKYSCGLCIDPENEETLGRVLDRMLNDEESRKIWKANSLKAREELCWEKEQLKLEGVFKKAGFN
jgi:glycosyltransferase involved in cell wall biosynthesis